MKPWLLITLLVVATIAAFVVFKKLMERAKKMTAPVNGPITSPFGEREHPVTGGEHFHNGIDYGVPVGTEIRAPFDGEVSQRYTNDVGGLQLILRHTNGYTTGYAHLSDARVNVGDTVGKGQVIALSGATGRVTGPHLHFTMRGPENNYLDPQLYLA
jgi:murein DD-endopeptidase MepM/ murein hydrolase activator NlpD